MLSRTEIEVVLRYLSKIRIVDLADDDVIDMRNAYRKLEQMTEELRADEEIFKS